MHSSILLYFSSSLFDLAPLASSGDDLVEGSEDKDTLYGKAGNDTILGHGGIDALYGEFSELLVDNAPTSKILGDDVLAASGAGSTLYGDVALLELDAALDGPVSVQTGADTLFAYNPKVMYGDADEVTVAVSLSDQDLSL